MIPKTCIITPFGSFVFRFLPFGLRNAGQSFQKMMDNVFQGMPFVFVYVDGVLIASTDHEEHAKHVPAVLEALRGNGLVVKRESAHLGWTNSLFWDTTSHVMASAH
jgi:hypothetical protein